MAEQLKFGDRLFLKGEKVLFDNGTGPAIIESRNQTLIIGDTDGTEHNVIINGNLTVEGTTTTVNTQQTTVADPFMLITSLDVDKAGIEVDRDGETNAQFGWNETENRWETFHTSSLFSSTMESTNLTTGDLTATGTSILSDLESPLVTITGGNIDTTVIGATTRASGKFTFLEASEDVTFSKDLSVQGSFTTITTDGLTEGTTNLYFTDERVDDRISNLFDASYGISATYSDPENTFEISFDATNIGTGEQILDTTNTTQAAFRTIREGQIASGGNGDLIVSLSTDSNEIVIDTAERINKLKFNTFPGTGTTSQYPLGYSVSYDWQVLVYIDGVVQEPTTAYTISGTTLTLSAPLNNGSVMNVIKMASNTEVSVVTDADTLNAQPGSYYLDYNNFFNVPLISQTTIGDVPPTSPLNGHLWWDSSTGRLKIYYEDIDSSQWVDTNPATGTVTTTGGSSYTDADVASYLGGNLDTHILPDTNDTYDIGSAEFKIRDLYLGDNSLHIGDNTLSTSDNSLLLNGEDIMDYSNVKNKPTTLAGYGITDGGSSIIDIAYSYSGPSGIVGIGIDSLKYGRDNGFNPQTYNTAIGNSALYSNQSDGDYNTAVGGNSLYGNTTGDHNTAVGYSSLLENTIGFQNVAIGNSALQYNETGDYNVAIGRGAGVTNVSGNNNVFIGANAGKHETGSNKLYIGSNNGWPTDINGPDDFGHTTLIKGDFSTGNVTFNDAYTFPSTDGTANQVLETDGAGNLSWSTPTITLSTLKSVVAASSDFTDFQSRIAAL